MNQDQTSAPMKEAEEAQPQQPPANSPKTSKEEKSQYAEYFKGFEKPKPEETILEWNAPSRPFKKRNRQFHTTVVTIALLLSFILFFAGQVITIAVVFAVAFLIYVMSTIPPHTITNKITTYGLRSEDSLYFWDELGRFWFETKLSDRILYVEAARFPHRLTLLLGKADEKELREILSEVLLEQKPAPNVTDKVADWLKEKVPLDLDS